MECLPWSTVEEDYCGVSSVEKLEVGTHSQIVKSLLLTRNGWGDSMEQGGIQTRRHRKKKKSRNLNEDQDQIKKKEAKERRTSFLGCVATCQMLFVSVMY